MKSYYFRNETKSIIAELRLKSIESNSIEGSSGRSLGSEVPSNDTENEVDVTVDGDLQKWQRVVKDTLAKGTVGNLLVDPEFLVMEPVESKFSDILQYI